MLRKRIKALQTVLTEKKYASLLVSHPDNLFYLTGVKSLEGYLLFTKNENFLFTDSRYEGLVQNLKTLYTIIIFKKGFWHSFAEIVENNHLKSIAFEAHHLSVAILTAFQKKNKSIRWKTTTAMVEKLREQKVPEEINAVKKACRILDKGFRYIAGKIALNITEKALAWELEKFLREHGADELAFSSIVASGKNSAIPHHGTSDRKIASGDVILIDAGVKLDGYCSDCTRTFLFGNISTKVREIYHIVQQAQAEAVKKTKAGLKVKTVDNFARSIIKKAGYGDHFGHGTGHGVGIAIHEQPRVSHLNKKDVLKKDSIITIEPGIYLPGVGGVRIEDTVLVKKDGVERLTKSKKNLLQWTK